MPAKAYNNSWETRFISPDVIIQAFRQKLIQEAQEKGVPLRPGLPLDYLQHARAFLEYFNEIGQYGWEYVGEANYPGLPFEGMYVFKRKTGRAKTEPKPKIEVEEIEPIETIQTE